MGNIHIQIVEANPHLRSLLGWHLQQAGYKVSLTANLRQGQESFQRQQPDLVILDNDLSDGSGLDFCRWLRQQSTYVLMLSAKTTEPDIIGGLDAGADDYVTKPFGIQEFLTRVSTLLRRIQPSLPSQVRFGKLKIDLVQRQVHYTQELVDLTPQEFSLLYVLVQANGTTLSRMELLRRAWPDNIDNPRTVDTHILSLRKKLENSPQRPQLIQTVRNVGYRLNMDYLHSEEASPPDTHKSPPPSTSAVPQSRSSRKQPFTPQQAPSVVGVSPR